jgi:hypothetical protein
VIARIQGQGTPSTVESDPAELLAAQSTQPIHLMMPGYSVATRMADEQRPASTSDENEKAGAATPEATAQDEPKKADDGSSKKETLLSQAQGRVDGSFAPSRPAQVGLGRGTPAAWRKAAESVAARAAALTGAKDGESAAEGAGNADAPAKSTRPRTARTVKKADPAVKPAASPRGTAAKAAKAAKQAGESSTTTKAGTAQAGTAQTGSAAGTAGDGTAGDGSASAGTAAKTRAASPRSSAGKATPAAKAPAKPEPNGDGGRAGKAANPAEGAADKSKAKPEATEKDHPSATRLSYKSEAAQLLSGATQRRRRSAATPEESPHRR